MKVYHGIKSEGAGPQQVYVSDETETRSLDPLPSQKIRNHSPDGFQWGYGGSGPAQLALAILLDHFGDEARAQKYYQRFKFRAVANFFNDWKLTSGEIDQIIDGFKLAEDAQGSNLDWTKATFNPYP